MLKFTRSMVYVLTAPCVMMFTQLRASGDGAGRVMRCWPLYRRTCVLKREFTVAGEYHYNRAGPMRWIAAHLFRYPHFVAMWSIASIGVYVLLATVPVLTGLAFNEVLKPHPDGGR